MRDVGATPAGDFTSAIVYPFRFVKIAFPAPTPTRYFTDKPGGWTGNLGDGSGAVAWSEYAVSLVGFSEGRDSSSQVTMLEFGNANGDWTTLEATPGLADVPVDIWIGRFSAAGALLGAYRRTRGLFGGYTLTDSLRIEVVPDGEAWASEIPILMTASCSAPFKDAELCGYAGAATTCARTIEACTALSNQANFLGLINAIPPGTEISWDQFRKSVAAYARPVRR